MSHFARKVLVRSQLKKSPPLWHLVAGLVLLSGLFIYLLVRVAASPPPTSPQFSSPSIVLGSAIETQETAATNEDGVPVSLHINGESWTVTKIAIFDENKNHPRGGSRYFGTVADTDCQGREIRYTQIDDPMALRTFLMHEVYHAGSCLHGGDRWWNSRHSHDPYKHLGIYHLGDFTAQFIKDNPIFVWWIIHD